MERCPLCKGEKKNKKIIYTVDLSPGLVIVKDVPAKVCAQCGEEWISAGIAVQLEKITDTARNNHLQLELVSFPEVNFAKI